MTNHSASDAVSSQIDDDRCFSRLVKITRLAMWTRLLAARDFCDKVGHDNSAASCSCCSCTLSSSSFLTSLSSSTGVYLIPSNSICTSRKNEKKKKKEIKAPSDYAGGTVENRALLLRSVHTNPSRALRDDLQNGR